MGKLGREHARVLAGLPDVELAGVYDIHAERGAEEAAKYGAQQLESAAAVIDVCDLVSVACPTTAHFEVGTAVIEAGKACFLEKPICATVKEAEELVALADRHQVPVGVGQIERYNPAVIDLNRRQVTPRFIEAHRLAGFSPRGTDVAVIFDLMIHDIDLVLHLVGEEPSHIHAAGAAVISDDLDICNARMEFSRGAVANLTASRISTFTMRKFRIFAERSYVALDLKEKTLEHYRLFDSAAELAAVQSGGMSLPFGNRGQMLALERSEPANGEMLQMELADFVQAVRTGAPVPVDGQAGTRALRVADQVHQQALALLKRAHLV